MPYSGIAQACVRGQLFLRPPCVPRSCGLGVLGLWSKLVVDVPRFNFYDRGVDSTENFRWKASGLSFRGLLLRVHVWPQGEGWDDDHHHHDHDAHDDDADDDDDDDDDGECDHDADDEDDDDLDSDGDV